ncbi:MAG TPA: ATP-binding protein [Vicinamibacteria bacterium]
MPSPGGPVVPSAAVAVADHGQIGEVQRAVAAVCRSVGLDEAEAGRARIVATEAAANVAKHGRGGEVVLNPLRLGEALGIEVLALDRGPGIPDMAAPAGGATPAGTGRGGFAAMRRQSSHLEVYTLPGQGTAVLGRIWRVVPPGAAVDVAALCVAKPGETVCGDLWSFEARPGGGRIVVADGLGHGPLARDAARAVLEAVGPCPPGAARVLEEAHRAARGTRGAAVAVVEVDLPAGEICFAGLGNIAAALVGRDRVQNMVSMNGTAGQGALKPREFKYRFAPGALLVVSSDGLASHWSLDSYPGLARCHPGLVAGVLYRDHSQRRDDVTVVAARLGARSLSP